MTTTRFVPASRWIVVAAVTVATAGVMTAGMAALDDPSIAEAAGAPSRFVALTPCRLLDTRTSSGPVAAGGVIDVQATARCGIPAGATAVAVTLTAVAPSGPGFVTVWPTGSQRPEASALNYRPDEFVANSQLVQLSADGRVSMYTLAASNLLLDVTGYFEPAAGAVASGRFQPVAAARVVDTRNTARPGVGGVVTVTPSVPAGATAVAVNITTTESSGPGFLAAYPSGMPRPEASVLNTDRAGQTRAAAAIVPLRNGAFDVYTLLGDHVIVDIAGYFTGANASPSQAGRFVPMLPTRLVDSRLAPGASGGPRLWDRGGREFAVASITGGPVSAVSANVTMTSTEDLGFVTAGPARVGRPDTSTVNAGTAQATVANNAIIEASTSGIQFTSLNATHLVVDITGWFTGAPIAATGDAPSNNPTGDRKVTIISDSAMAGVRWNGALAGFQGFIADARLESCRRLVQSSCRGREGYAPYTAQGEISLLPAPGPEDIVVIAVGYNDWHARFPSDFDAVVATARARGFHHIAWVNYRSAVGYTLPSTDGVSSNYAEMNRVLSEKVASGAYPEVRLWDFDAYTANTSGWFFADGVHETRVGSFGVADWISRHVRAFDDRPCAQPWTLGGAVDNPCPDPDAVRAARGYPSIAALYSL